MKEKNHDALSFNMDILLNTGETGDMYSNNFKVLSNPVNSIISKFHLWDVNWRSKLFLWICPKIKGEVIISNVL